MHAACPVPEAAGQTDSRPRLCAALASVDGVLRYSLLYRCHVRVLMVQQHPQLQVKLKIQRTVSFSNTIL
jgi:hypothetical protein